jgi:hypothetical protein
MASPLPTDILNALLAEEQKSLASRLLESTVFVSKASVEDFFLVQRLARTSRQTCKQLAGLILELGDAPWPRPADSSTAHLHFHELHSVMPRLKADLENRIRKCTAAVGKLAGEPKAVALAASILERHREDWAALQEAESDRTGAAAEPLARREA